MKNNNLKPENKKEWAILILLLIGIQLIGIIWTPFTVTQVNSWYQTLEKPSFNPPGWIFGPVWTVLYFIISLVGFYIYKNKVDSKTKYLFNTQLLLNFLWTPFFFISHQIEIALVIIISLFLTIVHIQIKLFQKTKVLSSFWFLYVLWVLFATILNTSIVLLN